MTEITVPLTKVLNALGMAIDQYQSVCDGLADRSERTYTLLETIGDEVKLLGDLRAAIRDGADTIKITR